MAARPTIVCLVAVAVAAVTVVACSGTVSVAHESVITTGAKAAVGSVAQMDREIAGQATSGTVDGPGHRSARLIAETGVDIHTLGNVTYTGSVIHEHVTGSRYRLSLILHHGDSLEWGLTAVHLPDPCITTIGASARFRVTPEVSAEIDISGSLLAGSGSGRVLPGFGWGTNLEWQRIVDPLALTAQVGYASHSTSAFGLASVGGSVALLVNDYISISGSGSLGWSDVGAVITQLGVSVAYQVSSVNTVYVTVQTTLSPSDSTSATLGISHELR
jgi:hypothetical protein